MQEGLLQIPLKLMRVFSLTPVGGGLGSICGFALQELDSEYTSLMSVGVEGAQHLT